MRVREDLGLAYSLYSYSYALEATGTFSIYAAASPANIARVHAEIHKELSSFLKNGCTEQEMQDGKNFLRILGYKLDNDGCYFVYGRRYIQQG